MTVQTVAPGRLLHPRQGPALGIDYQVPFLKKLVRDVDGRRQVSSGIAPEVQYHSAYHPVEGPYGLHYLIPRLGRKTAELEVKYIVPHLIGGIQTVDGYLVPDYCKVQQSVHSPAQHSQLHLRPFLAPQIAVDILVGQSYRCYITGIHTDNLVSSQQAHSL
ncbi:unknown [Alistipes sp. CAG:831]|nr:unknown [Alistipes sp. CAG:831]